MGMIKSVKSFIDSFNTHVFGTWDVEYDPSSFEREREDGLTIIGLNPDCRVFVCGAEITADVESVKVQNSMETCNTCEINIYNPRGKYEISKMDLMGKWREDKDILAAYDYKGYTRSDPLNWENMAESLARSLAGNQMGATVGQLIDSAKQMQKLVGYIPGLTATPQPQGVTRMIFETKYFSGLTKRVGDTVFDYRDPIYIFFKGRFSPYWYFGFSGIIETIGDFDSYGDSSKVTIKGVDTTGIWKRAKMMKKGAFYPMSNLENRIKNVSKDTKVSIFNDLAVNFNFSDFIKKVAFSYDYGQNTYNCHPTKLGKEGDSAYVDPTNDIDYEILKEELHADAMIDRSHMTTSSSSIGDVIMERFLGDTGIIDQSGIIDINDIGYSGTDGGPNSYPFSPDVPLYLQFNEMVFTKGTFLAKNFNNFFDLSVRYWESKHTIQRGFGMLQGMKGTGWEDTKAFGICGIHPALKYDFISNFNILPNIWAECYKASRYPLPNIWKSASKVTVDFLVLSPLDKIRETIAGSPTEQGNDSIKTKALGTSLNLFRPRLFLMLPQKYADRLKKVSEGEIGKLGQLFQEDSTSIYSYLKEKLKTIEYNMFCSPAGDIFIEPELYDMHPLDFCDPIDSRNVSIKKQSTHIRGREKGVVKFLKIDAHFYNSKANHPFFIMEKDRYRITQNFSPDSITSAVQILGGKNARGGLMDTIPSDDVINMTTSMGKGAAIKIQGRNPFRSGLFVADGFEDFIIDSDIAIRVKERIKERDELLVNYNKVIFIRMIKYGIKVPIGQLIDNFINFTEKFWTSKFDKIEWKPDLYNKVQQIKKNIGTGYLLRYPDTLKEEVLLQLFSVLNTGEDVNKVLSKKVNDYLKEPTNPEYTDKKERIIIKDRLERFKKSASLSSDRDDATLSQYIDSAEEHGIFKITTSADADFFGIKGSIINNLITLYEPSAINDNDEVKGLYKKILKLEVDIPNLPVNMQATTLEDLKKYASKGQYNPQEDIVRWYGYKRIEPIRNRYVMNGEEATIYARSVFNRLLGQAYKINIDFIGRPEMLLNRTYYVERKDCIGYMNKNSISYSFGGEFSSNAELTYIRKNAIAYDYTLGSELDTICDEITDNTYFSFQGSMYLRLNNLIAQAVSTAGSLVTSAMARALAKGGSQTSQLMGLAAANLAGGVVSDVATMFGSPGGLYSAHDFLGHIDYEKAGQDIVKSIDFNSSIGVGNEIVFREDKIPALLATSEMITNKRKELKTYTDKLDNFKKDKDAKEKEEGSAKIEVAYSEKYYNSITKADVIKEPKILQLAELDYKNKSDILRRVTRDKEKIINSIQENEKKIVLIEKQLYGDKMWREDLIKSNLDSYIKINYKTPGVPQGHKPNSMGLYYNLFKLHVLNTVPHDPDIWIIHEEPVKGSTVSNQISTPYYITYANKILTNTGTINTNTVT